MGIPPDPSTDETDPAGSRRIRLLRRRIRLLPSPDPGYPTLPGSEVFAPAGRKERLFWPKPAPFGQKPASSQLPWFPDPGVPPDPDIRPDPGCCTFGVSLLLSGQKGAGESRRKPASFWPRKPAFGQRSRLLAKEAGIPVYSRVFPCIPVLFRVFRVFRVFPGIPVYSRVFPVFPCIPGIPGYSRVFPVFPCIPY